MSKNNFTKRLAGRAANRRGAFLLLAAFCLIAAIGFVALGVDVGYVALSKQRMQNAVDAAALAAAMEITYAIEHAAEDVGDVVEYATAQSRAKAAEVAELNGVYINPERDVIFGQRTYDDSTEEFEVTWNQTPANVVKVVARRDNSDPSAPDAKVPAFFAGVLGSGRTAIVTSAAAYVESRDIVCVLDFSRSMNFDSYFNSEASDLPSQSEIEANLALIWEDLGSPNFGTMPFTPDWVTIPSSTWGNDLKVTWKSTEVYVVCANNLQKVKLTFANGNNQTFTTSSNNGTWMGTGSNNGQRVTKCECRRWTNSWETFDFYNNSHIKRGLGLTSVAYPWPVGSWDNYISMARDTSGSYYQEQIYNYGYRRKFGIMTFLHYLLRFECGHSETPDLWQTRHYPFHSVKEGQQLFCDFLEDLEFNDYVGLVSYDTSHRVEQTLSETGMPSVDISSEPITSNYQAIRDMIAHKQAGHYSYSTNMGGGLNDAKNLLTNHGRANARPTILLMTDGNANTMDSGESSSLPADWDWDELLDYDNDGEADYTTSDSQKNYVLKIAKQCVDAGYTIHTLSVGYDADREFMEAIAHLGNGIYIDVPPGSTTSDSEAAVMEAFRRIAAYIPPAKLMNPE